MRFEDIKLFTGTEGEDFGHLRLIIDNATRWNSLYSMVDRALNLRERIDRFCYENAGEMHGNSTRKKTGKDADAQYLLKNDALTNDDWQALAEVKAILQKFYVLTKRAEGSKLTSDRGVLSDYMTTLNDLLDHVRSNRDDLNTRADDPDLTSDAVSHLRACIVNCWTKLDEYFAKINETPAHYASVVTNPKMKWAYFEYVWKDAILWKDARAPNQWLPQGKRALEYIWGDYKDLPDPGPTVGSKRPRSPSPDDFERSIDMTLHLDNVEDQDELEAWIKAPPFRLDRGVSLPEYWVGQLEQRPRLARMALDMASIPAMSSDCERVFSQCKLLITGQRNRLKADIIEATQCLRAWLVYERKAAGRWKGTGNWKTPMELFNSGE